MLQDSAHEFLGCPAKDGIASGLLFHNSPTSTFVFRLLNGTDDATLYCQM